ncbi:type I secretion system permease/ATPase [Geomonas paludis]|uniref:ABC transporter n=1 Tax=Geomonas paludis TaxID=2740185 RepID=A0A6V8N1H9_9BACT|nr:type I secretion system permease/ATPase [Geomonas paludis]UPU37214.1 type I secretion system permease/ATPase [Geomonas paludis]GFO66356.1 ABC transporter [Geomonas paludis]
MPETENRKLEAQWNVAEDSDRHDDPLLDSLLLVAKLHGLPASRTGLTAGLPLVQNRVTVELFPRCAERAGLSSRLVKRPLERISQLQLPAILLLHNRQACAVVERLPDKDSFRILLPEAGTGEKTVTRAELEKLYTGFAIFVRPRYRIGKSTSVTRDEGKGNWFWSAITSSWRIYRDVLIASFLINVFALVSTFYILNVYDRVIPNSAYETLWVLSIGVTVVYLFSVLMQGLRGYFVDEAGKKANLKISSLLLQRVLNLRLEARPQSIGSFSNNLREFETILDFITSFSITAVIDLPFVVLGLIVIWYIGGGTILTIFLVSIALMLIYSAFIQAPLRRAVENTFAASSQKNAILVEGLAGLETVKMLGAESHVQRSWEDAVSYISTWSARSRFLSSSVNHVSFLVQNLAVVALVVAGVYAIAMRELTQGGLVALVILSRQVVAPVAQVANLATRYHRAKEAYRALDDIMKLPVERPAGKTFLHRPRFKGGIGVKGLTFAYPGQTVNVLNNISLQIAPGEKVGVIGPIGSGKTTLGKLLLGLFEPASGMVTMDDTDLRQIDPAELRHYVGYVPQDISLFKGTVRENLTLGAADIDDHAIMRAADLAGVGEFVKKHPMGFDMEVGEFGRGLSGGQRQCVAIARALLLDPPVLVFDEPTSNMDSRAEVRLKNHLAEGAKEKTMVLITHRASLLELVDRIIVIDNGTVIADGPKATVLEALQRGHLNI